VNNTVTVPTLTCTTETITHVLCQPLVLVRSPTLVASTVVHYHTINPKVCNMPSEVCLDKGKGCAQSTPVQEEGSPWHRNEREILPQMSMPGETWARLHDDLQNWSQFTEQGRAKALQNQKDIIKLQERVDKSDQEASELAIAIRSIWRTVAVIETQARSQSA
jgi:hypothetical protein